MIAYKWVVLICVLFLARALIPAIAEEQKTETPTKLPAAAVSSSVETPAEEPHPYPNELAGYQLYEKYCQGLLPTESTADDAIKVFGKPSEHSWERQYVFENDEWMILVGIYFDDGVTPKHMIGRIRNIDFVPVNPIAFKDVIFGPAFSKQRQIASVTWDDYVDAHGLAYSVYDGGMISSSTGKPRPVKGRLNRISYRPPLHVEQTIQVYHLKRKLNAQQKELDNVRQELKRVRAEVLQQGADSYDPDDPFN